MVDRDVLVGENNVENNEEHVIISSEEVKEIIKEIEIEITDEDREKYGKPKKTRKSKDKPTLKEIGQMSDEEIISSAENDDNLRELYMEFNSYLEEKFGDDIKEDSGIKTTISTGLDVLDAVMGGGFAVGTFSVIAGAPGSGKTTLAVQTMAASQLRFKGDIHVSFLDAEEAMTTARMSNLGVRYPKIRPVTNLTVENVFKYIEALCNFRELKKTTDKPAIVVWDSVANTLSSKEMEAEDVNSVIGHKARLLSIMIPKYVSKISRYNISLIAVNQLRDVIQIGPMQQAKDLNFMRQGKSIPGGNALKFNAFHLLDMRAKGVIDHEKFGFDGIVSEIKCVKNKLFSPNIKVDIVGNFITGFSNFWTNYVYMVEYKRINTGSWNYITSLPSIKFRTKEAEELYKINETFKSAFDESIKDLINTELIEKNTLII